MISAPPGFSVKGKFSNIFTSFQEQEVISRASAFETWKDYFSTKSAGSLQIQVPKEWVLFITSQLLSPARFSWISTFLQTQMWKIIVEETEFEDLMTIYIPDKLPIDQPMTCTESGAEFNGLHKSQPNCSTFCTPQGKKCWGT